MLTGQEEIMILMQQSLMQDNQGLPLLMRKLVYSLRLLLTGLDTLLLELHDASVYFFQIINELFLRDRPGFGLFKLSIHCTFLGHEAEV